MRTKRVFWSIAFSRAVVARAVRVAVIVGFILVAINHGDALMAGDIDGVRLAKILLTFFVPYCVSAYSAAAGANAAAARHAD